MVTQELNLFLSFHCLLIPCGLKGGQAPVELGLGTASFAYSGRCSESVSD